MNIKKKLLIGGSSALILLPLLVGASGVWSSSRFVLGQDQIRTGNTYVASEESLVAGTINGDLVLVSGKAMVTGVIDDDLLAAGGSIQLAGTVGGDVRLVAGESVIGGTVGGDVAVVGGKSTVVAGTKVAGDLLVVGGQVRIDGSIGGRVRISGGEVTVNGPVTGAVEVKGGRLIIGEQAVIAGNVSYRGPQAPTITPGAVVLGKTDFTRDDFGRAQFRSFAHGMGVLAGAAGLLMSLTLALVFFSVFKKSAHALTHAALSSFWPHAGRGLLAMIALPIISVIIMLTIVGLPIGGFGLMVFGLGNILAMALSGIVFGAWIQRFVFKKSEHQPTVTTVVWGTVALRAITFIPVVGWIVGLLFCSVSFGVLAHSAYHRFWLNRS